MVKYCEGQPLYVVARVLSTYPHDITKFMTVDIPSQELIDYIRKYDKWIPIKASSSSLDNEINTYIIPSELISLIDEGYGFGYIFDCSVTSVRNVLVRKAINYIKS